jgi:Tol biopolymer transport system component/predicted Ser/Thr protein kinase
VPLAAGDKLGPYEIVAPIGAGGMGEVYRAHDPRMGRDVAIKVAAERFSERFDREVRAVAALNHPNICALYDVGPNYLVMELIEGPTLADRIRHGAIPLDETLGLAKQMAEALEAAHEKGIVHRDLKPANIKINREGKVKVLDFGLAKLAEPAAPQGDPESSPTLTLEHATLVGSIMGTAGYMSPEQASGKPVDKRADIWSFGVVLWEMLTGKRLFGGETISHTLADVLRGPINFDQLPRGTPAAIRELLRRCLDRDVRNRLRDIGEARVALGNVDQEPVALTGQGTAPPHMAWIVTAVLGLGLIAVGVLYWRATRPVERPLVRLDVDLGADVSLPGLTGSFQNVRLSPDGTRLLYLSGNPRRLFSRRLDQTSATELPGTEGATSPFFSPDGQWVGYFASNKVYKISMGGGAAVTLADYPIVAGASWGADGTIILGGAILGGLERISDGGGVPTRLTELAKGELGHASPQILPGGKAVLFEVVGASRDADHTSIEAISLADHHRKVLLQGGASPSYLASGHLIYSNKGILFAIPFDPVRLETHGIAVPVLDGLPYGKAGAEYDSSLTGALVYRKGGGDASALKTIQWVHSTGRKEPLRAQSGDYQFPRVSPDGQRLAMVVNEGGRQDLWVYDLRRDAMTRLTFGGIFFNGLVWSPNGRYVVVGIVGSGIQWMRADGGGQLQPLIDSPAIEYPSSFTPDGKRLAYFELTKAAQIFTVAVEEQGGQLKAGKPEPSFTSQFNDVNPTFSPDGRWLATLVPNESGKNELYVRTFPQPATGQGGQWQISNSGSGFFAWSRDGRELLYQAGDQIMAVSYTVKGETFVAEKPRIWLAKVGGTAYDLSPDGKRLVVMAPVDAADSPRADHEVVFLENFFDELRRRVPAGK